MPYRRLPNTDTARIKALKTAIEKAAETDFKELSISPSVLSEARDVVSHFEYLCTRYQQVYNTQVKANKTFIGKVKNARMYLSHFVQVLYMCVLRSEIKEEQLELYGLENLNMVLPDLTSNEQLLEWGMKIIEGEKKRTSRGGVPIYNPSIAKVKVIYTLFKDGLQTQKLHQKATARVLKEVADYRVKVDEVIIDIWEQVEKHHINLTPEERLARNREYGVVYYYRKGEVIE
ncbi:MULTISPECIES: hypothetical protein [Proteiniphilum]|jgi:hypothetical protein|uniref:hypothetical protein n=1 Tax=Proteiniphilum TaxID=294702 RepID=UPI001EEA3043|nr:MULTISPECIES: hypothetical protein [Proteiniphilum]MDD2247558.1 hypothetical protein [Proteiniphilum sp.]ULB33064.1 hypothetical protein KDN43_08345 [Proteiniphilum propionicum]